MRMVNYKILDGVAHITEKRLFLSEDVKSSLYLNNGDVFRETRRPSKMQHPIQSSAEEKDDISFLESKCTS